MPAITTSGGALVVVPAKDGSRHYWEAAWRHASRAYKRRLGVAWVQPRAAPLVGATGWQRGYVKRAGNPRGDELTPQMAAVAMRALIDSTAATAPVASRSHTFAEAAGAWLDNPHGRPHSWSPATERSYRALLASPDRPVPKRGKPADAKIMRAFGSRRVDQITGRDVASFLRGLDGLVSANTVNHYHVVLSLVFADAARRGWRTGNPLDGLQRRRIGAPPALAMFTVAQVEAVAASAAGELGAVIVVAAMTGLRRGELVALRWQDVRFEQPAIAVERAYSAGQIKAPKSGKGRVVPLAARPLAVLRELATREHFTAPDDLVFARADGGMRDPDAVSAAYVKARNAAGVPALRFHDLRHTFGSLLAMGGVSAFEIQQWMGHSDLATTQRYLHFAPRADDAARISAALSV